MTTEKVKDKVIYVFVCLNAPGTPPDYYICTSAEARRKVKTYSTRGIIDLSSLKLPEFRERWDKIDAALEPVDER